MTMLQYAIMAASAGMLALAPMVGPLDQIQAGARAANQVSQYCALGIAHCAGERGSDELSAARASRTRAQRKKAPHNGTGPSSA
jgi:hypothetical protein